MTIRVRLAELSDVDRLQVIEIDAGRRFRDIGLGSIADDPPMSQSALSLHIADGTAWVAAGTGRQAPGRAGLLWVEDLAITTVTLTTFRDVAWNGPYYQRLGFVELPTAEQGPEFAVIRRTKRDAGLDVLERIAMRRQLPTCGSACCCHHVKDPEPPSDRPQDEERNGVRQYHGHTQPLQGCAAVRLHEQPRRDGHLNHQQTGKRVETPRPCEVPYHQPGNCPGESATWTGQSGAESERAQDRTVV